MKCYSCGKEYFTNDNVCPFCGNITFIKEKQPTRMAKFLSKQLPLPKLSLTYLNMFLILLLNLSALAIIINLFLYFYDVEKSLWCHYVVAGSATFYLLLKCSFYNANKKISLACTITHIIIITCNISQFILSANKGTELWATELITPSLIIIMSLVSLVLYLCGKLTSVTYVKVLIFNSIIITAPFILTFIPFFEFHDVGRALIYSATACSYLSFVNFILIRIISSISKLNKML